jgi:HK97 family phage major capsid protein
MGSNIKSVPRSAGLSVDYTTKGTAYGEDTTTADEVVLTARKFTRAIRIAEEDIADSLVNIISTKQVDWATSYAKAIDNATLAVTATVGAGVPFNSVYYALTQTNANTSYTANTNLTKSGTAAPAYAGLNTTLKLLEISDYFDDSRCIVIAHPSYRGTLRGILDSQNRPIFIEYQTPDVQSQATLFGMPLRYSLGAKTSATATSSPGGNPLLIFLNPDYLLLGVRSGPESAFAPADSGVGFLTDDALLKMRSRRGFGVGNENAFSVYENNSGL